MRLCDICWNVGNVGKAGISDMGNTPSRAFVLTDNVRHRRPVARDLDADEVARTCADTYGKSAALIDCPRGKLSTGPVAGGTNGKAMATIRRPDRYEQTGAVRLRRPRRGALRPDPNPRTPVPGAILYLPLLTATPPPPPWR